MNTSLTHKTKPESKANKEIQQNTVFEWNYRTPASQDVRWLIDISNMSHQPWAGLWCSSTPLRLFGTQWPEGCHQPPTLVEWQRLRAPSKPRPLSPSSRCLSVGSPAPWQCRHPSSESPPPVQCLPGPQASLWYDLPRCHCVRAAWISLLFQLNLVWVNSEWWGYPSHAHSYPPPLLSQADRSAIIHTDESSLLFRSLSFSP